MNPLRDQLRQRRHALGLSVYEVAKRARSAAPEVKGLQQAAFGHWEDPLSGRSPSDDQLVAWAAALEMTIELKPAHETAKEKAA